VSTYVLFTAAFWKDTAERTVATAAQAVAATWGADVLYPDAFSLNYKVLAGVAAGGALAALVKQVAKLGLTAQVPTVPADPPAPIGAGAPEGAGSDEDVRPIKSGGDVE
jgi:hypothetical protein